MEKILINLSVPSVQENYDVFVPSDLEIGTLVCVLASGVQDLCNGRYSISEKEMLIRTSPDAVLNPNKTLSDYDIDDGTRLVLI